MCERCSAEQQTQGFDRYMDDGLRARPVDLEENPEGVGREKIGRCRGRLVGLDVGASRDERSGDEFDGELHCHVE